jgi:hypothetical protein
MKRSGFVPMSVSFGVGWKESKRHSTFLSYAMEKIHGKSWSWTYGLNEDYRNNNTSKSMYILGNYNSRTH